MLETCNNHTVRSIWNMFPYASPYNFIPNNIYIY